MKSTGKFDIKGREIFVGDKVLHPWVWFWWEGQLRTGFKLHTITAKESSKEESYQDSIFCLGDCYNLWKGETVEKLSYEQVETFGIKEEVLFFFNEGKVIEITDRHIFGGEIKEQPDNDLFWTAERIERPKIYLGTCKRSAQGYTNINSYWVQCEDGLYRSKSSTVELTQEQIESDVKQGYLKRIRNKSFEVNFIKMFNNE